MFSWFVRRKAKKQLAELFAEYVSPELLNAVASSESPKLNELSEGPVEFLFVLVQCDSPNETGQHLGTVATVARRNGWMVQDILCNLVVLVHGTLLKEPRSLDRPSLVDKLLQAMAPNIKIVHGSESAFFGNMGGVGRVTYGVLLPSFLKVLSELHALPYGRSSEFRG